jgi:hypothetical protein
VDARIEINGAQQVGEEIILLMKTIGDIYIAGSKTTDDWMAFKPTLVPGGDPVVWETAFAAYFHGRLSARYLDPIKVLQDNGSFQGEGFSIAAIQCSLIEFLESTVQGKSYRLLRGGPPLGPHEYSRSGEMFESFFVNRAPFNSEFDAATAHDFYEGVRCALLHEARTKNGWVIWAKHGSRIIDATGSQKILYRDNFQKGLLDFIAGYKTALTSDPVIQAAFIRKFDSLCV